MGSMGVERSQIKSASCLGPYENHHSMGAHVEVETFNNFRDHEQGLRVVTPGRLGSCAISRVKLSPSLLFKVQALGHDSPMVNRSSRKPTQIERARTPLLVNIVVRPNIPKWRTMQPLTRCGFFEPALSHPQGAKPNQGVYIQVEEPMQWESTMDHFGSGGLLGRLTAGVFHCAAISDKPPCSILLAFALFRCSLTSMDS